MDIKKLKNAEYEFPLADGTTVKTTITFYLLYQLKGKNRALYERYNKILQHTGKDDFDLLDMVTIVYVGYVCAHLGDENRMTEEEFLMICGSDITAINKAVTALIRPK